MKAKTKEASALKRLMQLSLFLMIKKMNFYQQLKKSTMKFRLHCKI